VSRRADAGDGWSIEQWLAYRQRAVEYLATDPGWIVGEAVVAMCDQRIAHLRQSMNA
jgi:hypothetical protein